MGPLKIAFSLGSGFIHRRSRRCIALNVMILLRVSRGNPEAGFVETLLPEVLLTRDQSLEHAVPRELWVVLRGLIVDDNMSILPFQIFTRIGCNF